VRLLLDTHIAYWLAIEPSLLNRAERALLEEADSDLATSAASLWEMRIKWSRQFGSGARKGPVRPADLLTALVAANIPLLDLSGATVVADLDPPLEHSDPFDALLLTHAQQTGRHLLTRDKKLASHPVALVAA
jgi:PIN domain nuclease of toxin-antitoxin system